MLSWLWSYWTPTSRPSSVKPYFLDGNCKRWNGRCQTTICYEDLLPAPNGWAIAHPSGLTCSLGLEAERTNQLPAHAQILNKLHEVKCPAKAIQCVRQILMDAREVPALNEFDNIYVVINDVGIIQLKNMRIYKLRQELVPHDYLDHYESKLINLGLGTPEEFWPGELQNQIVNRIYHVSC